MDETELKKAKFYALKVLNFRPRSMDELSVKLKEKGFSAEVIAEVNSEFVKKGLLNDAKFSRLWIESRMSSRPKGAALLRRELEAKGVKDSVIEEVIGAAKKDYDEYEVVKNMANERMRVLEGLDKTTVKRRLFGYLKRRGFSTETVMKVIREGT